MPRSVLLLPWLLALSPAYSDEPKPATCLIQPDATKPIHPGAGRIVHCALDLGSRTAKLSVVSMQKGRNATIRDERQCKRTLGLGERVFDSKTGIARPLAEDAIGQLADTIRVYQKICALDGGSIVAAGATQWARDATNIDEVKASVRAATGVDFEVLTPKQEADYSYVAASVNTPGRIVLDPGSNSFELAWQERGAATIVSVLVKHGYVRGSVNDIEPAADYAAGRAAYQAKVRALLEKELTGLTPPLDLAGIRRLVKDGKIGPELVTLGQDGAVQLAVRGLLRDGGGWIADASAYDDVVRRQVFLADPSFGLLMAKPLLPSEITAYLEAIKPADFKTLASEPARSLYGQRALAVPALAELLIRELDATRLVVVPQEITTGHILAKLPQ